MDFQEIQRMATEVERTIKPHLSRLKWIAEQVKRTETLTRFPGVEKYMSDMKQVAETVATFKPPMELRPELLERTCEIFTPPSPAYLALFLHVLREIKRTCGIPASCDVYQLVLNPLDENPPAALGNNLLYITQEGIDLTVYWIPFGGERMPVCGSVFHFLDGELQWHQNVGNGLPNLDPADLYHRFTDCGGTGSGPEIIECNTGDGGECSVTVIG